MVCENCHTLQCSTGKDGKKNHTLRALYFGHQNICTMSDKLIIIHDSMFDWRKKKKITLTQVVAWNAICQYVFMILAIFEDCDLGELHFANRQLTHLADHTFARFSHFVSCRHCRTLHTHWLQESTSNALRRHDEESERGKERKSFLQYCPGA